MQNRTVSWDSGNKWYKLDNAAKIYPAISNANRSSVFRVSAELKEPVKPQLLQNALTTILPRFPTFAVRMSAGFFWYFFEPNIEMPVVMEEKGPPCRSIDMDETNGYLFRLCYYHKRLSLEVFHSLTDGFGALTFLKAVIYAYLTDVGYSIDIDDSIPNIFMPPPNNETQDSFMEFYDPASKAGRTEDKAYQISGTRMPFEAASAINGTIPLKDFTNVAKENDASITQYAAALLIYSIYSTQLKGRRGQNPVKVSVPVNLRRFFQSTTLRNFSTYVNVGLAFNRKLFTFEEILQTVSKQLKEGVQPEKLLEKMSVNVNAERKIYMRAVPLALKNILLKLAYVKFGESLFTCSLSNLGAVQVPSSMQEHIEKFEFVLGVPVLNKLNCGICSYKDTLVISFTRTIFEPEIERFFFRYLAEKGLDVVIESN